MGEVQQDLDDVYVSATLFVHFLGYDLMNFGFSAM